VEGTAPDRIATQRDHAAATAGALDLEPPLLEVGQRDAVRPGIVHSGSRWIFAENESRTPADSANPRARARVSGSDPNECRRTLLAHGFTAILVTRVALEWRGDRPEAVLDLIHGGAVRAAMLIEAQATEDRQSIHAAIVEAVSTRRAPDGRYLVRRPAVLTERHKPSVSAGAGVCIF